LEVGIIPGRLFVSEIASCLLPGMELEALEAIVGLPKELSVWRDRSRPPEPESLDWQPVKVRPAITMPANPKLIFIPMNRPLPRKVFQIKKI
jgi:hypothetical protein